MTTISKLAGFNSKIKNTSFSHLCRVRSFKQRKMSSSSFPIPYTIHPLAAHKHTIIALHGLGSTGSMFADRLLFEMPYSTATNTDPSRYHAARNFAAWTRPLPMDSIKFVFPTAPTRRLTVPSEREVPAWFQIASFTDLEVNQDMLQEGLRESVEYLHRLVQSEIEYLEQVGRSSRDLIVVGRSQGSSVVGWTAMSGRMPPIGGVVVAGSWLVYARALRAVLIGDKQDTVPQSALNFAKSMFLDAEDAVGKLTRFPILMGHSVDDQWINVSLGRQYRDVLRCSGFEPDWREYEGADEEGHWFKEPKEFEALAKFVLQQIDRAQLPQ